MIREISLGQYFNTESILHRIDPRVKIRFTLVFLVLALLDRNLWLFSVLSFIMVISFFLAKIPFGYSMKGTTGIWIAIFLLSAINIISTPGDAVLLVGGLKVTNEGIVKCFFVFWRMLLIINFSSLLTYTTTPTELTDGFEKCFHLSGNIAMGMTIAMRFIGIFFEELHRIMQAQEIRGANFKTKSIKQKIINFKNISIPLFQNAINRANNLGNALDAKCYTGGKGRTKLIPLVYKKIDFVAYLILLALTILGIYLVMRF